MLIAEPHIRETEAVLRRLKPLVGIMAGERAGRSGYDDARQEGLIAVWRAASAQPDAPPRYLAAVARNAVKGSVAGRAPFGAPSHQGRREPLTDAVPLEPTNAEGERMPFDREDRHASDAFEAVERRDVIERALATLTAEDRRLIELRYWQESDYSDAAAELGRSVHALSRRWNHHVKPALRVSLAELAAA